MGHGPSLPPNRDRIPNPKSILITRAMALLDNIKTHFRAPVPVLLVAPGLHPEAITSRSEIAGERVRGAALHPFLEDHGAGGVVVNVQPIPGRVAGRAPIQ